MATAQQDQTVNIGGVTIGKFKVVETLPPNSPFSSLMNKPGVQSTPSLARGNLNNSIISLMNGNLSHACDFRFTFDFNLLTEIPLLNPVTEIQKAFKNAKLAATNMLAEQIFGLVQEARTAIKAIMKVLNYDPSGSLSLSFEIGKDLIEKVNEAIQWVAKKVETVMTYVYLAQMIQELINWIASLPDRIKKLLQACLTNFTNSIKQVANTISSIPDQIINATTSQINTIANEFSAAALAVQTEVSNSLNSNSAEMPDVVYSALLMSDTTEAAAALKVQLENDAQTKNEIQTAADMTKTAAKPTSSP